MSPVSEDDVRDMKKYGEAVTGPIVYAYTEWVLFSAVKRGIKRLWFLSRDGYLPYLIAKKICCSRGLNIDCRYLYCSRKSLRSASYHLISDDEMSSQLFVYGYYVSVRSFVARLDIDEEKRCEIICNLNIENKDAPLSREEFSRVCNIVRADGEIFNIIRARSSEKYNTAIAYFESIGLFDSDTVAIVDSGWTGSVQHSLRVLLDSVGYKGKIAGFYFGMYREADACDGEFFTYYFNAKRGLIRRVLFNNNLLECMLSAPHPMTEKYSFITDVPKPCFFDARSFEMQKMVIAQISGAIRFADIENIKTRNKLTAENRIRQISRIIYKAMICPDKHEAELFSKFFFCDDMTEKYMHSLADESMLEQLREYMIIPRILCRVFRVRMVQNSLLWPYGVTAYLPWHLRLWYRSNLLAWDLFKSLRQGFVSIFRR